MRKPLLSALLVVLLALPLSAATFWEKDGTPTPTVLEVPTLEGLEEKKELPASVPVEAPQVDFPTPTPTPLPGLAPKDPTTAALLSVAVPGGGQVYAGDPLKGLAFAAVFGVGLWQTLDNFALVEKDGEARSKDETLGHLFGLATLAAYGFGIQDAYATAEHYNRSRHLSFRWGVFPEWNAALALNF